MKARFGIPCLSLLLSSIAFAADDGTPKERSRELQSLIESYEKDKARVLAPIDHKFDRDLEQLKLRFTQLGKLEEAVAVMQLIEARKAKDGETSVSEMSEQSTRWDWDSRGMLVIYPDGTCKHSSWKRAGTWQRIENNVIMIDAEPTTFTVKFLNKDKATVTSAIGKTITITRIK